MVSQFSAQLLLFKQNLERTEDLRRGIAADIQALDQTTVQTRELIVDCRRGIAKADQLLLT